MKKGLMLSLLLLLSSCASVPDSTVIREIPKLDAIVITVDKYVEMLWYSYEYDTKDSEDLLEERTRADAQTFLRALTPVLQKEMTRIIGTQPGQTKILTQAEIRPDTGEIGMLWLNTKELRLMCVDHSKRCIVDYGIFNNTLVHKAKPAWKSTLNVNVGANFSGEDNDKVTMEKLAKKLVKQLHADGYIALPLEG